MGNDPRQQNQNPNQRRDESSINDPNKERDNDGQRRQQEAEQQK